MDRGLTFAGLPACTDLTALKAEIAIVGAPHGTSYQGGEASHAALGPEAIRRAAERYGAMVHHHDFDLGGPLLAGRDVGVVDCGDLPGDPGDPAGNRRGITEAIRTVLGAGAVPIVLGGDDSIPIPFFRAFEGRGPLTVVQVDAHIDWRHEVDGVTEGPSSTMRRASEMDWIERLVQVGIRGVGSARAEEVEAAREFGVELVTAREVEAEGVGSVLRRIPEGVPCLLTLDCDGLDPSVLPAVKAPVPGGLTYRQVIDLIHGLAQRADLRGFDLVELVPEKDVNGLGALTAARIVWNAIGALARAG